MAEMWPSYSGITRRVTHPLYITRVRIGFPRRKLTPWRAGYVSEDRAEDDLVSRTQMRYCRSSILFKQMYKEVLVEMVGLQRTMATQDSLLRNLIQGFASGGGNLTAFMNQGGISHSSSQFDMKANLSSLSSLGTAAASASALETQSQPSFTPPRSLVSLLSASTGIVTRLLPFSTRNNATHQARTSARLPICIIIFNPQHKRTLKSQPTPLHVPNPIQNESQYLQSRFDKKRRYKYECERYQTQHEADEREERKKQKIDRDVIEQRMGFRCWNMFLNVWTLTTHLEGSMKHGIGVMFEWNGREEEEEVVRPSPPGLGGFSISSILSSICSNELSIGGPAGVPASSSSSAADPGRSSNTTEPTSQAKKWTPNSKTPGSSSSTASSSTTKTTTTTLLSRPVWTNPPRVLLVDNDDVSRKLSSKIPKPLGAVDKMEGNRGEEGESEYDPVLMDIITHKLDGVSNVTRPQPAEVMTYYSSGNEKTVHKRWSSRRLGAMQAMNSIPRSIGVPPVSNASH
ncbi:hypothetical protein BDN72DRAFT_881241 [Pluteus cervinus]|uniref:Uncharacterized protein n=1 Tax=Pluteus cervinus TaxID=181527 RepID=A0ACD3AGP3_9AGAR|nr:hypothetical protein BDN72DRAFT_881241 [Pluteus cervinus]